MGIPFICLEPRTNLYGLSFPLRQNWTTCERNRQTFQFDRLKATLLTVEEFPV